VLIAAGGFQAGRAWAAAAAIVLLSLGFLGLAHALLETIAGKSRRRDRNLAPGLRGVTALAATAVVLLAALVAAAVWLPGSDVVDALLRGTT